ncbi:hypothetical protein B0H14DRAFT_3882850 [Mycena olivaceomarginata]|nr:hypothetical protein B0H14DRAFT_3882850 [Mycena olivaceomarginata]
MVKLNPTACDACWNAKKSCAGMYPCDRCRTRGIPCIVKKGARATEGKHQNTKQLQGIIASAAPLVPVAQVVFSTASLVPPQAARSATESEFANFEDLFALLDPTPAVQTQGAAGAPVLHEDWPPLSESPTPAVQTQLGAGEQPSREGPESAPPNGFEGIESNRFPVGSILHELFSPLPSWIVNNTAPPVPLQTAPVAVLDDELLALINQNFPAPGLPVASHLQAIATLLEAAPPASSTLLTQLRTIGRALDRSRAPEYAQTAIDYLDRLAGTIDGIRSLPPKSTA